MVITRKEDLLAKILLLRRNALNVERLIISPQIARTKKKKNLARARDLRARRSYSRNLLRRRMARIAMLSGIRMLVPSLMTIEMMMRMKNLPRRVLPVSQSRKHPSLSYGKR